MQGPGFSADLGFFSASNSNYHLHCHSEYEIFMFIEGDSKYVVEDKNYSLEPYDVIIIRKHEMHRVFHNDSSRYHSLVFFVYPEFFHTNGCEEYEQAFFDYGKDNKIDSSTVFSSGLQDAIDRLTKYSNDFSKTDSAIVKSILIEILHIINGIKSFEKSIY